MVNQFGDKGALISDRANKGPLIRRDSYITGAESELREKFMKEFASQDLTTALDRLGLTPQIKQMVAEICQALGSASSMDDITDTERIYRHMLVRARDFLQCLDEPLG